MVSRTLSVVVPAVALWAVDALMLGSLKILPVWLWPNGHDEVTPWLRETLALVDPFVD